jgi:hypothetical protein
MRSSPGMTLEQPSLIEICRLNSVDPFAYLSATLSSIVNGHRQSRVDELLRWS